MLSVPVDFVVALLLAIALARLARRDGGTDRWVLAMVAAYMLQAVQLGLRWGYGLVAVQPTEAVLAAALPPLSWIGFARFTVGRRESPPGWWHTLPPLLIAALWFAAPWLIDPVLEPLYVGYGVALLRLGRRGPDALDRATLDGVIPLNRAVQATGTMLVASAAVDLAITLVLLHGHQRLAAQIAGAAGLVFVALLGWAASAAGENASALIRTESAAELAAAPLPGTAPNSGTAPDPDTAPDGEDSAIAEALDSLMQGRALHRDPALTLDRLARRLGLPARRISWAVNRARGVNVSQYVNGHRVADACRLLADTDLPVIRILFDVGFQTKSNFNREFLRVTGTSPSAWRAARLGDAAADRELRTPGADELAVTRLAGR